MTRAARSKPRRDGRIRSPWASYVMTARYLALFAFACFFLMPVYALLVTALKSPAEVSVVRMWQWPHELSLDNFRIVWPKLRAGFENSVLMAVPASVISSMLGAANGFVLAKWRFPGADFAFSLILFGMFIPYQAVLIPMFQTMSYAGLRGGLSGLILVHVIYGLPITTLIFRSYFAGISEELIEAAKVDGAGMLATFFFVALPIAPPAFAVSMIWQFTSAWNDFLFGVLLTNTDRWPITVALNNIAGSQAVPFNEAMASALLACLPTLLVYVLLGRFFMRGLMAGALKG
jgi:glucose/mannose transport system permease protein